MIDMRAYLRTLSDMGPKPCGSAANAKQADFLLEQMRKICPNARQDAFTFSGWRNMGESGLEMIAPAREKLDALVFLGSGGGSFEGRLVRIGLNHVWGIYSWHRYAVTDARGEVVAYLSGRPDGDLLSQTLIEDDPSAPHMIVGQDVNARIAALLEAGEEVRVRGYANCEAVPHMQGANIIADFYAKNPVLKPIVITAHRDTMYNTSGAYDNQAGCIVLLALAERLANMNLRRSITIAFTDGEECRLAGGRRLAERYAAGDLAYMINVDGIGRGDEMEVWIGPVSFEKRVMRRLIACMPIEKQCYRNPPPAGSDHTPFYEKEIPSVMLTFNDQGIIHTPEDVYNERLIPNMEKMLEMVLQLLDL